MDQQMVERKNNKQSNQTSLIKMNWMKMNGNEWKWMKMNENEWKWMEMNENEWKWMKMNENEVICLKSKIKMNRF